MNELQKVINYIEDNLNNDMTLDDMSKALNYSKYYLSRNFNTKIGMSIPKYMMLRRLSEVVLKLKNEKVPINEIIYHYGFNSSSYFAMKFKEHFGITPSAYLEKGQYIHLRRKIELEDKMTDMKNIDELVSFILKNVKNQDDFERIFANINDLIFSKFQDEFLEIFYLLKEKDRSILYFLTINLLMGTYEKYIIANDEFLNGTVRMRTIIKEDELIKVEVEQTKKRTIHEGNLVYIGQQMRYLIDVNHIEDEFVNSAKSYHESPGLNVKKVEAIMEMGNNIEIENEIADRDDVKIIRAFKNLYLIAMIENGKNNFSLFTVLIDMNKKISSYNCVFIFNNFGLTPSLKYIGDTLTICFNDQYLATVMLLQGKETEYLAPYAIEFANNRRGLSSLMLEAE